MSDGQSVLNIISTFNRAGMLPEAIESVLSQDYPHKNLVIVDDGSTDGTRNLCGEYVRKYPEVINYIYKENGGCASARNAGLDLIDRETGYVCFLDSDDRFLPGKLSREVSLLQEHMDADFVYGDSIIYDEASRRERTSKVAAAGNPENFALMHFFTNEAKSSALLYRVDTVRNLRFREDLRYNEDSEFLQRVAIKYKGIYSPEPGCWVRWHKGSKSRNFVEIHKAVLRSSEDILRSHPDFYRSNSKQLDWRIHQIKDFLYRELVIAKRWEEASGYATNPFKRCFPFCFSLYYRVLSHLVNP